MPVFPLRSLPARCAVVVLSCLAVLGLVQAAAAGDDLGLRRLFFWPEQVAAPAPGAPPAPVLTVRRPRAPRRIWAAARARPLRIALGRHRTRQARAARRVRLARAAAPLLVLPRPARPALVSIFEDRTLRDGDAVMLADGIHLFRGGRSWPHRAGDFVRLRSVATLGWTLRQTLADLDAAPPDLWPAFRTGAG